MKREVSRDKNLSAFSLDLSDLELLLNRLRPLFSDEDTIYSSIKLELKRESLDFENVEEIRLYNGLKGRFTKFRFYLSQGDKRVSVHSGLFLDSRPSVSATSSNEAWCAGAIETVSSFVQARRQWYFWFVSWPIGLILIVFGNIPMLAKTLLPKAMHLQGITFYSWLFLMLSLVFLYFTKSSLLPYASIVITQEDSFLRRHIGELSLLVVIASAVLTVIGIFSGK
jgi:hypothetical protein